jgi:nitronate monooxygenase/enoyl-[acyl-carrier protein] reductase II
MLRTRFCELFEIEAPVLQAPAWPATSPELVAAVSQAGALGSLAAVNESADRLRALIERVRQLTDRPFVVNHVVPRLDDEAFEVTLEARPAAVSFALGDPGALVERARSVGAKVIHQVHTVAQAREAADLGVDLVIAQGNEAGGQGLVAGVGALALVPQVVDAVAPIPVLVAGGVADGRGLAAGLVLGAAGANVGTRFLASEESGTSEAWKQRIVDAESDETVRFETWSAFMPVASGYAVVPRVIRTEFIERWERQPDEAREQAEQLREQILATIREGRQHEAAPFAGETVGLIHELLPAAEIVRRMVAEAEQALEQAAAARSS